MSRFWFGTRKGLIPVDERGGAWQIGETRFKATPVTAVLVDHADGGRIYVGIEHGHYGPKLHRSDDGGLTFQEVGSPAFPEGEEATVKTLWVLSAGSSPGRLWCGTISGGLFHSTDRGATWSLVRSLWDRPERHQWFGGGTDQPGIHSIEVDPRDRRRLLLAISCGGVWHSPDDGATWEQRGHGLIAKFMPPERQLDPIIQDPHRIARCAAEPDVVWCQHHSGVFRSTDDGKTFHELHPQPSSFGFGVLAHPQRGSTAWFVPAGRDDERVAVDEAVVVTRTDDGGASFVIQRDGLPQKHAFDLVYRHALAVREDGLTLAFGSTTGNAWVSADGGARWQTIGQHLPPIYAVAAG